MLKWSRNKAGHSRFIRVMSNTPAAVGNAASEHITIDLDIETKRWGNLTFFYGMFGGSRPAYIFAAGLPRDLALGLAYQTLKDDVASPRGTTIESIHELDKAGFRGILMNAVVTASKRIQELSNN
ncbi:Pyrroline-5-carboxylate reductase [Forsythia ovata]|uniref:Pyrroline-5-carboxylate reductase n=1 Tax=Forsythia ovata TaxID=205694 RepID=A0ABD1SM78_9LAMI